MADDKKAKPEQIRPPKQKQYRFLEAVDYAPNGRHYPAGTVDALADWKRQHINNALRTGHIKVA